VLAIAKKIVGFEVFGDLDLGTSFEYFSMGGQTADRPVAVGFVLRSFGFV